MFNNYFDSKSCKNYISTQFSNNYHHEYNFRLYLKGAKPRNIIKCHSCTFGVDI